MNDGKEPAIGGYDAVSYFDGSPQPGRPEHEARWNGQTWRFATAGNRERFTANPSQFAPQFGGSCAFATSLGKEAPGSPRHWLVRNGKLYFALKPVARLLFRILPGRIEKAEAHWLSRR